MNDVFAIAQIFIDHIKATCPNDVCIVAAYGSYLNGNPSKYSDLDLYYIPDTNKADNLYRSFVAFELPFEFWGVPWDFAEKIAAGKHRWSIAPSILVNSRVLHARSEADLQRYQALQQQIAQLQQPASRPAVVKLAFDAIRQAQCHLSAIQQANDAGDLTATRWAGCMFTDHLLDCLCLINQTHFIRNWTSDVTQLAKLSQQPAHLQQRIANLVTSSDAQAIAVEAGALLQDARQLLMAAQLAVAQPAPAKGVLRDYYMAIKEYVNKLQSDCDKRNLISAAFVATKMQVELAGMLSRTHNGIEVTDMHRYAEYSAALHQAGFPNLTNAISAGDFEGIRRQALEFDAQARLLFAQHGVSLNEFMDEPALRQYLCQP